MGHMGNWAHDHDFLNTAWIFTKILLDIDIDVFYLNIQSYSHDGLFKCKNIERSEILIDSNIGSMNLFHVLVWNLAHFSVISGSFPKIFLLKISLISTYKMPPHLLSNLLKALSNLSPNIQNIGSSSLATWTQRFLTRSDVTRLICI